MDEGGYSEWKFRYHHHKIETTLIITRQNPLNFKIISKYVLK